MYKLKTLCLFLLVCTLVKGQNFINYQAIAWDKYNLPKADQDVKLTFNIRALHANGTIEYTEFAQKTTDSFGLFAHKIGESEAAKFAQIDWSRYPKYLQVIVDGKEVSTTQLMSVPYAMFAEHSNMVGGTGIELNKDSIKNSHKLQVSNGVLQLGTSSSIVLPKVKVGAFSKVPDASFSLSLKVNILHRMNIGIEDVGYYLVLVNLNYSGPSIGLFHLTSFGNIIPQTNVGTIYSSQSFNINKGSNQFWALLYLPTPGWMQLERDPDGYPIPYSFSINNASMALIKIQ